MKRVEEKVKDIVEVRPFTNLHDFAADPSLTLGSYYFTDITADLMVKWLDRIAMVKPGNGCALALAGFRGVGKSHFLAAISAIVSHTELRAGITDSYVAAGAERLGRRHNPVAVIGRGSGTTLLAELKSEIASLLSVSPNLLSDSLYDLLLKATEKCGDQPLVLLFDTALGRKSRVERDDGDILGEIAEAAKTLGIFVGVALDDDISGADGPNSSISRCFSIDYLDQEHLYKIVDSRIFYKHRQMLPVLRDIYENYRSVLPSFRWSEQRFSALYPLHPATLEIAPLIRLYIHDFALLGFASEAGVRILGRPANSLIGLDEIFDGVESRLRLVGDLNSAFEAFDAIEKEIVPQMSVQQRLPAKLVMKGLFLLSLDGQGANANELAAAMTIVPTEGADDHRLDIEGFLSNIANTYPASIKIIEQGDGVKKFAFKFSLRSDADAIADEAAKEVTDEMIHWLLRKHPVEKYSNSDRPKIGSDDAIQCAIEWRGSIRSGSVAFDPKGSATQQTDPEGKCDWTVNVVFRNEDPAPQSGTGGIDHFEWVAGELTEDEKVTLRRHYVLQSRPDIRELFGSGSVTIAHVSSLAVEKIWNRVFFEDGELRAGSDIFRFSEEARSSFSLSQLFTGMLGPVFESRYAAHPEFVETLTGKQSATLLTNFFGGANSASLETQHLAEVFAFPLGLAERIEDVWVPTPAEKLAENPLIKLILNDKAFVAGSVAQLETIRTNLLLSEYGLTREPLNVILAALAAQRQIEFVTSSGNRINHRSLDLQILWEDIVGVAKPLHEQYSLERLLSWAKLVTGNSGLRSVDRSEDRLLIIDSLSGWLLGWNQHDLIAAFDSLPDEYLNSAIWKTAASLRKSFGTMAERIEALIGDEITLDECLHSIAAVFADSHEDFEKKKGELRILRSSIDRIKEVIEITAYLALCEPTDDVDVENSRSAVLSKLDYIRLGNCRDGESSLNSEWTQFNELFATFYDERHRNVMVSGVASPILRDPLRSSRWAIFNALSRTSFFEPRFARAAEGLIRRTRKAPCNSDVRSKLVASPMCGCSFRLGDRNDQDGILERFDLILDLGLASFGANLRTFIETYRGGGQLDVPLEQIERVLAIIGSSGNDTTISATDILAIKGIGDLFLTSNDFNIDAAFPENEVWELPEISHSDIALDL